MSWLNPVGLDGDAVVAMAEIPWPEWPRVCVLDKTNFNTFVKPRDDTERIIAATLQRMPYAQPVLSRKRPPPPLLPEQIAARKVARMKRLMAKKWPRARPDAKKREATREYAVTKELAKLEADIGPAIVDSLAKDEDPPKEPPSQVDELRRQFARYSPSIFDDPVGTHVLREQAKEADEEPSTRPNTTSMFLRTTNEFFNSSPVSRQERGSTARTSLGSRSPCTKNSPPREQIVETARDAQVSTKTVPNLRPSKSVVAGLASSPKVRQQKLSAAETYTLSSSVPPNKHNSKQRDLQLRLAEFIAREEPPEEVNDTDTQESIMESMEMVMRRKAVIDEASIADELHIDKIASTLAEPLDSTMVYCHSDVLLSHPNATIALAAPVADNNRSNPRSARLTTTDLVAKAQAQKAEWQRILGEDAKKRGDTSAAYKHFEAAASLYEANQLRPKLSNKDSAPLERPDVFVYTNAAHVAAIRLQRNFRRHLGCMNYAITRFKAHFRGARQREINQEAIRRDQAAAKFLQRPIRHWNQRRVSATIKMQARWRARIGRQAARERRHELALAKLVVSMGPILKGWLQRHREKREHRSARYLQHVWRGCKIRIQHAEDRSRKVKVRFDASALIQRRIRIKAALKHLDSLRENAREQEALRSAAELYWLRSANQITTLRTSLCLESSTGRWALQFVKKSMKHDPPMNSTKVKWRAAFMRADVAGTGTLGYHEAMSLLRSKGVWLKEKDTAVRQPAPTPFVVHFACQAAIIALDPKKSGRVSFDALWRWLEENKHRIACRFVPQRLRENDFNIFGAYLRRLAKHELVSREVHGHARRVLTEFRARNPPPFECPACRRPFALFTEWWGHFDTRGFCTFEWARPAGSLTEVIANPFVNNLDAKSIRLLRRSLLVELTRRFDELAALDFAATTAELSSHHARKFDTQARHEFNAIRSVIYKRIQQLRSRRRRRRPHRCTSGCSIIPQQMRRRFRPRAADEEEQDLADGVELVDMENRGRLNHGELGLLFFALSEDWRTLPCPGLSTTEEAAKSARIAADAALHHAGSSTISALQLTTWWQSPAARALAPRINPARLYRRMTPSIVANGFVLDRVNALARQGELRLFRRMYPPKIANSGLAETQLRAAGLGQLTDSSEKALCSAIDNATRTSLHVVLRMLSEHAASSNAHPIDARIVPTERDEEVSETEMHANAAAATDAILVKKRAEVQSCLELEAECLRQVTGPGTAFDASVRRATLVRTVSKSSIQTGTKRRPTENELITMENIADRRTRALLRTRGGKLAVAVETLRCDALVKHLDHLGADAQETHDANQWKRNVEGTLAALPYVIGSGHIDFRDLSRILYGELRIDQALLQPHYQLDGVNISAHGFVSLRDIVYWNTINGEDLQTSPPSCSAQAAGLRNKRGHTTLACRERVRSRTELWCLLDAVASGARSTDEGVRRTLRHRLHWLAVATERDILRARVVDAADARSRRILFNRECQNYLKWEAFNCAILEREFADSAKTCADPRMAAMKQAEHVFKWFDTESQGSLSIEILGDLLRRFGIYLTRSQGLVVAQQVANSAGSFKWSQLQTWLLASSMTVVQARLAQGWRRHRYRPRRDARRRFFVRGRQRVLAQLDLMLAVEQRWQAISDMQESERLEDDGLATSLAELSDSTRVSDPFDPTLRAALTFSDAFLRQRVGPYDGAPEGGQRRETSVITTLLTHAEGCILRGCNIASAFAKEYSNACVSLISDLASGNYATESDAAIAMAPSMAKHPTVSEAKLPHDWYYWFGQTRDLLDIILSSDS